MKFIMGGLDLTSCLSHLHLGGEKKNHHLTSLSFFICEMELLPQLLHRVESIYQGTGKGLFPSSTHFSDLSTEVPYSPLQGSLRSVTSLDGCYEERIGER